MAGLLDFLQTPQGQGLLSGVASYAMNARKGTPINNIGRGLAGGLVGYNASLQDIEAQKQAEFMNQFRQMQMDEMKAKRADAEAQKAQMSKFRDELPGMLPPVTPKLSEDQFMQMMPEFEAFGSDAIHDSMKYADQPNPIAKTLANAPDAVVGDVMNKYYGSAVDQLFPKPKEPIKLGKSDRLINPNDYKELVGAAPDPVDYNKPFLPDGTPNAAYQDYATKKAKAGATNIVNKIDNKTGESMAAQIGPMLKDSRTRALGAVKMAESAERLGSALESGKVIAGPYASKRLFINQLGTAMGITGPESVTQTRQVIRALAESSVEARKELQGQGQVTENEAKAVEKAMSGNIDDMTVPELQALVSLNKKAAKFTVEQHKFLLDEAGSKPELQGVSKFYGVPGMERVLKYQTDKKSVVDSPSLTPAEEAELKALKEKLKGKMP